MITIPRPYRFPTLLTKPEPRLLTEFQHIDSAYAIPFGLFSYQRDFAQELDDLSEEEAEIEDIVSLDEVLCSLHVCRRAFVKASGIRQYGFSFLLPMGASTTLQEQKRAVSLHPLFDTV